MKHHIGPSWLIWRIGKYKNILSAHLSSLKRVETASLDKGCRAKAIGPNNVTLFLA